MVLLRQALNLTPFSRVWAGGKTMEIPTRRHKFEGRDFCLRIPVAPVTKSSLFGSLIILKIITINNCNG